jgi:predicted molibdopterin-dependent oxidoreductase YjgC
MAKDYPLPEIRAACERLVNDGAIIFQKWTCGGCGKRVTANTPNTITEKGHHEECGYITDMTKTGCNYLLGMPIGKLPTKH